MLYVIKKNEFRRAGGGGQIGFAYWVEATTPAEIELYKEIQGAIPALNSVSGTRLVIDDNPNYNGKPNPNIGKPIFVSYNGPLADGTELLVTESPNARGIAPNPTEDAPTNSSLEREWVKTNDMLQNAIAHETAKMRVLEIETSRKAALQRRMANQRTNVTTTEKAAVATAQKLGAPNLPNS